MSDTRYPTRMHEVLGVETGQRGTFNGEDRTFDFEVDDDGILYTYQDNGLKGCAYACEMQLLILYPERITRRPRLTEEQVRVLEALYEVFDFKWIAKQKDGRVMAYANRPNKSDDWHGFWFSEEGDDEEDFGWWGAMVKTSSPVSSLISWSDPAPLDIVQTLRDAGVEVDDGEEARHGD